MVALGLVTTEHLEGEVTKTNTKLQRRDQTGSDVSFVFLNRNPDEEAGEEETKHS